MTRDVYPLGSGPNTPRSEIDIFCSDDESIAPTERGRSALWKSPPLVVKIAHVWSFLISVPVLTRKRWIGSAKRVSPADQRTEPLVVISLIRGIGA